VRTLSFFDPSLRRRLLLGGLLAVCGAAGATPFLPRAAVGGRFQGEPGAAVDLFARAGALAAAAAVAACCAAVLGPLWRRRWCASVLAAFCVWPVAVATTVERGPHYLPQQPLPWAISAAIALATGVYVAVRYPKLEADMRERYIWARAAQMARARRRAAG
jgi:hypothetical protein